MKLRTIISIVSATVILFNSTLVSSQSISVDAGTNQIINWEKTHSAQLEGTVSSKKI